MTHFKVLYAGVLYMWCTFFFLQSKLHHGFSIFTAIFCSTSYVSTLHGHFLILTDFLSSVSALSSSHTTSHYFVTRIPSLLSELPMNNVIGQWVHIHMGIPGNELIADGMAKRSLELSYITQVLFPADSIRRRLTTYYRALWQSHQLGLNLFSLSCLNFYCPISSPPPKPEFTREEQIVVTRLHLRTCLWTRLHLFKKTTHLECSFCQVATFFELLTIYSLLAQLWNMIVPSCVVSA